MTDIVTIPRKNLERIHDRNKELSNIVYQLEQSLFHQLKITQDLFAIIDALRSGVIK